MAFDFPSSPAEGQVFTAPSGPTYVFNAPTWKAVGQGQIAIISDTPPPSPANGALWYESDSGILFIWVNDGNSSQWVQVGGVLGPGVPPSDGEKYVMVNGVWQKQDGVVKISESGATGGAAIDILLPSGYREYEIFVNDLYPGSAQYMMARFSYDNGVTFSSTAAYGWGFDYITTAASAGWAQLGAGGTTDTKVQFTVAPSNSTIINAGSFRFRIPRVDAGVVQGISIDGWAWSGTTYYYMRGFGRFLSVTGPISAIRLSAATGNIAAQGGWQLNGVR